MPVEINQAGEEGRISATYWAPAGILEAKRPRLVVLVSPTRTQASNTNAVWPEGGLPFLKRGLAVLEINSLTPKTDADQFKDFYTTYNRTELQQHVRDLLTVCSAARSIEPRKRLAFQVTLIGSGRAGLLALLAAPGADAVIADCDRLDAGDESALVAQDLFCPGILALGGFETAGMLAAPHPLILHNTGEHFTTDSLRATYAAAGTQGKLRVDAGRLNDEDLAEAAANF
jgi:hypothetical protein